MSSNQDDSNSKKTVIVGPGVGDFGPTRIVGQPGGGGAGVPQSPQHSPQLNPTVPIGPGGNPGQAGAGGWPPPIGHPVPSPQFPHRPVDNNGPTKPHQPEIKGPHAGPVNPTRVLGPEAWKPAAPGPANGQPAPGANPVGPEANGQIEGLPVVGWLVVVKGPGKGKAVEIKYGNNSIGRDASQHIRLNFGDDSISSVGQAFIRYNPRDRSFLLIPNLEKSNFVWLNDDEPTMPVKMNAFDRVRVGQTWMRFVPFCSDKFDWSDPEAQ